MNNSSLQKIYSATELVGMVAEIGESTIRFCAAYAATIATRPEVKAELIELGLTVHFLNRAERIGRGDLDSRLLIVSGRQYQKLASCPPSEQKAALDSGVEVFDGAICDSRLIPVAYLSNEQANQVFALDHIRTIAEQRTWLAEHAACKNTDAIESEFIVTKKGVTISKFNLFLKRSLLKQWLKESGD